MKTFKRSAVILATLVSLSGCAALNKSEFNKFISGTGYITCYSGGNIVYQGQVIGAQSSIASNKGNTSFIDMDGKEVFISNSYCIFKPD